MRFVVIAGVVALVASACKDASRNAAPDETVTAVKTSLDGGLVQVKAPDPSAKTVPDGTTRIAGVPAPVAVHFVADGQIIARLDSARVRFATSSEDPLNALLHHLGAAYAKRRDVTLIGPSNVVANAAKARIPPRGNNVDIDFGSQSGDVYAKLLADASGIKVHGKLGGQVAVRVKNFSGNELLAILAAMCNARFVFSRAEATLIDSQCSRGAASDIEPYEVSPPVAEEPAYDDLGQRTLLPTLDTRRLAVAALRVGAGKPRALLTSDNQSFFIVEPGDTVGKREDACGDARPLDARTLELEERASKGRPAGCAAPGGMNFHWRVEAIDTQEVRFAPVIGLPDHGIGKLHIHLRGTGAAATRAGVRPSGGSAQK